jgi:hypothetical protein
LRGTAAILISKTVLEDSNPRFYRPE